MHRGPAAYVLGPPPSRSRDLELEGGVIACHTLNFAQVKSMDDNCGEWVECMGVATGCGFKEILYNYIILFQAVRRAVNVVNVSTCI